MRHLQTGLTEHDKARATEGYTLFTPMIDNITHLIDMDGKVVHEWTLPAGPGAYAYLLPNGNLLAAAKTEDGPKLPARGGHLVELDWDGNIVWEHVDNNQHHDFRRLSNGNTVYLCWELLSKEDEKKVIGGVPGTEHEDGVYGDIVREVTPDGEIVWEWRAIDHLDGKKFPLHVAAIREEWAHANTICPVPDGNFIINFRHNNLMAIIDKQTKEFSWTCCNLDFRQHHDVQMLENGNILFFANDADVISRGPEAGSRIIEIDPKTNDIVWQYQGNPPASFYSWFISGCQRLWSGNTLICEGVYGRLFEVTPDGDVVWEYISPYFKANPPQYGNSNRVFRCYRYRADSPEINGRV